MTKGQQQHPAMAGKSKTLRRADSAEQKDLRAGTILAAARRLLATRDFDRITMAEIAGRAGVAKGTVFLYFGTKEEVFLRLAEEALERWERRAADGLSGLEPVARMDGVAGFCEALVAPVVEDGLGKLLAILDDTLERNIALPRAREFKLRMRGLLDRLGARVEAKLPGACPGDGAPLLQALFVCLIGAYKVSTPSAVVRRVIAEPGMEVFDVDFARLLQHLAECHVAGYLVKCGKDLS